MVTFPSPFTSPNITISTVFTKFPFGSYTAILFPVPTIPLFSTPELFKILIEPAETEIFFLITSELTLGSTPVTYVSILYLDDEILTDELINCIVIIVCIICC